MRSSSLGVSRIVAGETDLLITPRGGGAGRRLVLVAHGAGGSPLNYLTPTTAPGSFKMLQVLADRYAVICTDFGGAQTWGTDVVLIRFDTILTWAAANLPDVRTDKVLLYGASMGNWTALRCAADRPTKVQAVAAHIPLCDINDIRATNAIGARAPIDAAWGVTYPTAIPARGDLLARAQAGELAGLPWKGWYSSGDTVTRPATVSALVSAIGSTASAVVTSTADHSDLPIAATDTAELLDYFASVG